MLHWGGPIVAIEIATVFHNEFIFEFRNTFEIHLWPQGSLAGPDEFCAASCGTCSPARLMTNPNLTPAPADDVTWVLFINELFPLAMNQCFPPRGDCMWLQGAGPT